jgi:hypothetical protein
VSDASEHLDDQDLAVADLLRGARPAPEEAWVRATERGVIAAVGRRRRERTRAAVALCSLAGVITLAGLVSSGPLSIGNDDSAKAKPGCTLVHVTKVEQLGQLVKKPDGEVVVESRDQPVTRTVSRCR